MLAARQDEKTVLAQLVGQHLQVGQQCRNALDFVNDCAPDERRKKSLGIEFGELSLVG